MTDAEFTPEDRAALDSPLGRAFLRLFRDPDYAERVATDPDAALAGEAFDRADLDALVSDAEALEGAEVSGFSFDDPLRSLSMFGGLRTPARLGLSTSKFRAWPLTTI